jgi:recombination protein RecA
LGQGRENSKQFIADNPELFEEIKTKVLITRGVLDNPQSQEAETNADDSSEMSVPD